MAKRKSANANVALNGLMVALLNGNPAVQDRVTQSGKSLDDLLGSMSAGQPPTGATRGLGLGDLFGDTSGRGAPSGGMPPQGGGGDILGSLLSSMLGGGGAPAGGTPAQSAGEDALGSLLGSMFGGGPAPSQPPTQPAGGDMLGSLLGGTLGGSGGMPAQGGVSKPKPKPKPQKPTSKPKPKPQVPTSGADPIGSLLGGLLGVNMGGGTSAIANNPIANAFVAPIAEALAKKTGLPQGLAQVVVVFALTKLLSAATGQASQARFDPSDLVNTLATDGTVTQKYLKDSGLVSELAQQSGLDPKTASTSLQQTFAALGTHIGEGSMADKQAELQSLLGAW